MNATTLIKFVAGMGITLIAGTIAYGAWQDSRSTGVPNPGVPSPNVSELPQTETWLVVRVSDGDTIVVGRNGQEEKIRLCGIDAPEKDQPLGDQSKDYLTQLLQEQNGEVGIVPVERDRYGRLVAEVFLLGEPEKLVQEELLKAGMAYVYPQYVDGCWNGAVMKAAEAIGQEQQVGVWSGDYQKPWEFRKQRS